MALAAALTLRHAIAKSGTNTLEGYFHPRQLAFSLGVLALVALMRRRIACRRDACLGRWASAPDDRALVFDLDRRCVVGQRSALAHRRLIVAMAPRRSSDIWMLVAGPLAGRLVQNGRGVAGDAGNEGLSIPARMAGVCVAAEPGVRAGHPLHLQRRRRDAGLLVPGEHGLVWGCLSLLVVFALALPLNAARLAIVIQLQMPRIFWMLDLLAIVYLVWVIAEDAAGSVRRARNAVPRDCAGLAEPQRLHQVRSDSRIDRLLKSPFPTTTGDA